MRAVEAVSRGVSISLSDKSWNDNARAARSHTVRGDSSIVGSTLHPRERTAARLHCSRAARPRNRRRVSCPMPRCCRSVRFGFGVLTSFTRYDALLGGSPARRATSASLLPPIRSGWRSSLRSRRLESAIRDCIGSVELPADGRTDRRRRRLAHRHGAADHRVWPDIATHARRRDSARGDADVARRAASTRQPGHANVGSNPAAGGGSAAGANGAFVTSVLGAAATLQNQLAQCQTSPSSGTVHRCSRSRRRRKA